MIKYNEDGSWVRDGKATVNVYHQEESEPIETISTKNAEVDEAHLDWYGDPYYQKDKILLGGMCHYLVKDTDISNADQKNMLIVPPTSAVQSVNLMPYLAFSMVGGTQDVIYDRWRFPLPDDLKTYNGTLHRIKEVTKPVTAKLVDVDVYGFNGMSSGGGAFNWRKESKLFNYPYSYIEINDHVSTPFKVIPHLFTDLSSSVKELKVKNYINAMGMYTMFMPGYKGDDLGITEGVVSSGITIPSWSSAYTDFMSANQATLKTARLTTVLNTTAGVGMIAAGAAMSLTGVGALPGVGMTASGMALMGANSTMSGISSIANSYATERNAENSVGSIKNSGGDALFNYQQAALEAGGDRNAPKVFIYKYQYPDDVMERLGWFFHMYGYKQNKVMKPNLKSRSRFNYVKCSDANLKTTGVAKEHAQQLKAIFTQGVTIWHVDNGVTVKDYSLDNKEV